MKFPTYKFELQKISEGFLKVGGCDEVGVAPLAGPVVAAAVILDPESLTGKRSKNKWWYRIRDSKTVNEKERGELEKFIKDHAVDFAVREVSHETIDQINIHQASLLAMKNSIEGLQIRPDFVFLDGLHKIKNFLIQHEAVVDGDAKILSISSASILAKVYRDEVLAKLHETYPVYGFEKHKGYPTKFHREAIMKYGVCPVHRKSFAFVKENL